jgi:PIN domain nuclease of toxin-antitoxin system
VIYIIDTHILLWHLKGEKRLPEIIRTAIEDANNETLVSKASLWEIAIKVSIGKLELHPDFEALQDLLLKNQFKILEFDFNDLSELIRLPFHHQDPFDRLIIAQAKNRNMTVISDDDKFKSYDIQLFQI